MRVKAGGYEHEGGVTLYLVPETAVERVLLRSLWKRGELPVTNGVADRSGQGFAIREVADECSDTAKPMAG